MLKAISSPKGVSILAGLIALIQGIDILIHAATNQLEVIRVTSNAAMVVWLVLLVAQRLTVTPRRVGFAFIGLYLALNLLFLATQGTINPQTDQPRTALLVLVGLTMLLASLLSMVYRPQTLTPHGESAQA